MVIGALSIKFSVAARAIIPSLQGHSLYMKNPACEYLKSGFIALLIRWVSVIVPWRYDLLSKDCYIFSIWPELCIKHYILIARKHLSKIRNLPEQ